MSETGSADETFNQRVERQMKYIPALKRNQLPAPDGEASSVALDAIEASRMETTPKCKVTEAERLCGAKLPEVGEIDLSTLPPEEA